MSFDQLFKATAVGPFKILTVCTGNICRSPLAEALLKSELADLPVKVTSAGTHALVGSPMTDQNNAIARRLGVADLQPHSARQLLESHLEDADLVLALSRSHRRKAVELLPKVGRYIFTLREFGRLASSLRAEATALPPMDDAGAKMRDAVSYIARMRGTVQPPAQQAQDDVVDPYRESDEVYEESAAQIVPAVQSIVSLLREAADSQG